MEFVATSMPGIAELLADELSSNQRTVRRMIKQHIEGKFFLADRRESGR